MNTTRAAAKSGLGSRQSPYCAFKNDRARLWALVSRDIRWVLVIGIVAIFEPAASHVTKLLTSVLGAIR